MLRVSATNALDLLDLPVGHPVYGTVKHPDDDPGHPSGQWSGALEKTEDGFRLTPIIEAAPFDDYTEGTVLIFYRGARKLATLTVLAS